MWCRLLDRPQACFQQTQPAHSACTTTIRQEGAKEIRCLQAEKDSKRQAFVNDLCSRLDALEHSSEDVDVSWTVFRDIVHSSAMDSIGPVSGKHQNWFDENDKEIQGILEEKHQKHKTDFLRYIGYRNFINDLIKHVSLLILVLVRLLFCPNC